MLSSSDDVGTPLDSRKPGPVGTSDGLTYRLGKPADVLPIAATLLEEKMNPLAIKHERFVICESASGERVAFGQIRPLASSRAPDPSRYDQG